MPIANADFRLARSGRSQLSSAQLACVWLGCVVLRSVALCSASQFDSSRRESPVSESSQLCVRGRVCRLALTGGGSLRQPSAKLRAPKPARNRQLAVGVAKFSARVRRRTFAG